jgi:hypothetical protein
VPAPPSATLPNFRRNGGARRRGAEARHARRLVAIRVFMSLGMRRATEQIAPGNEDADYYTVSLGGQRTWPGLLKAPDEKGWLIAWFRFNFCSENAQSCPGDDAELLTCFARNSLKEAFQTPSRQLMLYARK